MSVQQLFIIGTIVTGAITAIEVYVKKLVGI